MKRLLLIILLALFSCHSPPPRHYWIGRNLTTLPQSGPLLINIEGFTNALFSTIGKQEKISFSLFENNPEVLYEELQEGTFDAALTNLAPSVITKNLYSFSDPILSIGPALVVRKSTPVNSLKQMQGKIIGVSQFDNSVLIVQNEPSIVIELYKSLPEAFDDLIARKIDGLLVPILEANIFVKNRFPKELRIATGSLDNQALRLATLKGENSEMLTDFNEALRKLKKSSRYKKLRKQFNLP